MKKLSHITVLLTLIILSATSCKKDWYDQPNTQCVLTHSEDDLFGYSFDIVYNNTGDPASVDFAGFLVNLEYDDRGRLIKTLFGEPGSRTELFYNNNSFLPAVRHYIRPDLGGLLAIDSFKYNVLGQRIKTTTNLFYTGSTRKFVQYYQYDNRGNIKKITMADIVNGIETSPNMLFEGIRYDNQLNAFSGNQWLKFLFDLTEFSEYSYLQFSVNNALDWKWYYGNNDFPYLITSTLNYNPQGFATTRNGRYFDVDGVTELASFIQSNTSSCDVVLPKPNQKRNAEIIRNDTKTSRLPFINKKA